MQENKEIEMTDEDNKDFETATHCFVCGDKFDKTYKTEKEAEKYKTVRDHCHFTGKYRGCAAWPVHVGGWAWAFAACLWWWAGKSRRSPRATRECPSTSRACTGRVPARLLRVLSTPDTKWHATAGRVEFQVRRDKLEVDTYELWVTFPVAHRAYVKLIVTTHYPHDPDPNVVEVFSSSDTD